MNHRIKNPINTNIPPSESISHKIIRNTIFNILGKFWGILVALILTPYIIHHIGLERYGIWAIVGVITGYFGLLDFGVGTSFVKYISEYYAKKDNERINQVINTGFVFYSIFAGFIITLGFIVINPLLAFFKIPSSLYNEALFVFLLGIILFCISNALSPFAAIQTGLQRMDITNKVAIAISIPMIIGTIFFLEAGYGLPGLMINNAIVIVVRSVVNIAIAFKILPELKFSLLLLNWKILKRLFSFGIKLQVDKIGGIFIFQTDKLLISHFLNVGLVAFYQLGSLIINNARAFPLLLVTAIMPAASEINAKEDKKKLHQLYIMGTKYLIFVGVPLLTFIFFTASSIMLIWMGEGYEKSVLVIQILVPCFLINFLTGVGSSVALGMGNPEFQMRAGLLQAVLNIILSVVLVIKIGFLGVVIATLISLSLGSIYFMILFHRNLNYSLFSFLRKTFFVPVLTSFLVGSILGLVRSIYTSDGLSNRLTGFGVLGLEGIAFMILYLSIILKTNYLDEYDKSIFKKLFFEMTKRFKKRNAE